MPGQIAMLDGLGGRGGKKGRKARRRSRRNYGVGYHTPMHYAGLGADESGGINTTTLVLLGAVAVGAFFLLRKKDEAASDSSSQFSLPANASPSAIAQVARNAAVAARTQYTRSLYE